MTGGVAAQIGSVPALTEALALVGRMRTKGPKIKRIDIHSSKLTGHLLTLRAFRQLAHFWHTLFKVVAFGPVFSGGSSHGAPQESRFERTSAASHGAYAIKLDEAVTTNGVSGPYTRLGGRERA